MQGRLPHVAIAASIVLVAGLIPASAGSGSSIGDTTVFTLIPDPGMPEGIYVDGDRVFVGTHAELAGNSGQGPSHVFVYDRVTGDQIGDIVIQDQKLGETHGILGMAMDDQGRLYVLDRAPARVVRLTLAEQPSGTVVATGQETYATFPNLPPCPPGSGPGPEVECSPNTIDQAPFPDYLAFTPDGDAYVTDLEQAVIYRVPAGGLPLDKDAEVWFADPRLDSVFATNGIALSPGQDQLFVAMTGSMRPAVTDGGGVVAPTQGAIYTLPATAASPAPEDLELFHAYPEPATGPDGIAFGASGKLYVALAGASQMSILSPTGEEVERFPGPVDNQLATVPYDMPASIAFDDADETILVTNQAFFTGNEDHWAVLEAVVKDTGLDLVEPSIPS